MNYSTAVFLINDRVRAVSCSYEEGNNVKRKLFKTFDATIAVNDLVVVPTSTRYNMTVCKVMEVDVEVDFDDATPVGWIVGKVYQDAYKQTLADEAQVIATIAAADKTKKRNALRDALLADNGEAIMSLPIVHLPPADIAAPQAVATAFTVRDTRYSTDQRR